MDKREFAAFAAALQTYFPRHDILPNREAMELWYVQLNDIPYSMISAALAKWVATEKWPPTIAELREQCSEVAEGKMPEWGDGWQETVRAVRRYGFMRPEEALASMSPATRETCKRISWTEICTSENPEALRAQFRQVYETVSKRMREDRKMPDKLKATIDQLRIGNMERTKALES